MNQNKIKKFHKLKKVLKKYNQIIMIQTRIQKNVLLQDNKRYRKKYKKRYKKIKIQVKNSQIYYGK